MVRLRGLKAKKPSKLKVKRAPQITGGHEPDSHCAHCGEIYRSGTKHSCDILPWKLSGRAVALIRDMGAPIPRSGFIDDEGNAMVKDGLWDERLYPLNQIKSRNDNFLGLSSHPEIRDHIWNTLFDKFGQLKRDTEIDSFIKSEGGDESSGQRYEDFLQRDLKGPFMGKNVLIVKKSNIQEFADSNPSFKEKIQRLRAKKL